MAITVHGHNEITFGFAFAGGQDNTLADALGMANGNQLAFKSPGCPHGDIQCLVAAAIIYQNKRGTRVIPHNVESLCQQSRKAEHRQGLLQAFRSVPQIVVVVIWSVT
jgi:hypothetical protein